MPSPWGVIATGFNRKTLEEVKADIEDSQRTNIHPLWDVSTESPIGQINGIISSAMAELWEVAEAVYHSFDPDAAFDQGMVQLALLTGTRREDATKSLVPCTVTLDSGTYAAGVLVASVAGNPDARFVNRDEVVSVGSPVTDVIFEAEETGPVDAPNGELTVIAEPYTGFNAITNTDDADLGSDIESIVALRARREEELQASGSTNIDAIRDNVAQVDGVVSVKGLENLTQTTDANGLPSKSFEILVYDGTVPAADDDEIAQAIWDAKAAGMRAFGSSSGTAIGSDGQTHTMYFSRVTVRNVYLEFDVTGDCDEATVKAAVVAYGDENYQPGDDVVLSKLNAIVTGSDGVDDLTATRAGFSASPVGTANLSIGTREVAALAVARIDITEA